MILLEIGRSQPYALLAWKYGQGMRINCSRTFISSMSSTLLKNIRNNYQKCVVLCYFIVVKAFQTIWTLKKLVSEEYEKPFKLEFKSEQYRFERYNWLIKSEKI